MVARLLAVPYGPAATVALAEVVAGAKGGDALEAVTVVVPSATVGITLRRRLATDGGGLVGVGFRSLPQVADQLVGAAGTRRPPLPPAVHAAHVRAVLAGARPPLDAVAASATTVRSLVVTFTELAQLDERELAVIATTSARAAEVVRLHGQWRAATAGWADPQAGWRAATAAVVAGTAPLGEVGPLVVHLPRRLRRGEVALLGAVASRHPLTVLVGRTGDPAADVAAEALLGVLGPALAATVVDLGGPARPPAPTAVVRAPDPAEEGAVAARYVVAAVASGTRPERIAVVSRVGDPYAAVVHDALTAAGIDHHGPSARTLAQTVAGRTLTGLLGLADDDLSRAALTDWLRAAPVLDPATGRLVPTARWDRAAREAGVVGGRAQWAARLGRAAGDRRQHLERRGADPAADRRLAELGGLAAFVEGVGAALAAAPTGSWSALVAWAESLLTRYLGDGERVAAWVEGVDAADRAVVDAEGHAHRAVVEVVRGLAALDGIGAPPGPVDLRRALADELERPAGAVGRFGHGVLVGRPHHIAGADLDLVVVLGLAEGDAPPRRADDALVPARERLVAGGALAPRGLARDEEHRDHLAALAAAPCRIVSFARTDPRAMRERQPSRWLLAGAAALAGRPLGVTDLDDVAADWFVDVASSEWWSTAGRPPATVAEAGFGALLGAHHRGIRVPALLAHPVVTADPALHRGLLAAHHRTAGGFDAWNGRVATLGDVVADLGQRARSPTGLEQWAGCPFRYFLAHVLGLRGIDDPTGSDDVESATLGTLVHAILERLVAERGPSLAPGEPWRADDRVRAHEIAEEEAAALAAAGRTGQPLLWRVRWDSVQRNLDRILDADDGYRRDPPLAPAAVELGFGTDTAGETAVEVALPSGRMVRFKGRIDRVDRSADGRHLSVVDYKTGYPEPHKAVRYRGDGDGDLTASGTKLQLPIYALAARQALAGGDPEVTVDTHYWSIDDRHPLARFGGRFDAAAEARFVDVLDVVTDGIEAGHFPARPGQEEWTPGGVVHAACRFCDFDAICPTTRGERWETMRTDPSLTRYVTMADHDR